MPKPRKHEMIRCQHFVWRLYVRDETYYADGRSNPVNAGRHSLGTSDRARAMKELSHLDRVRAEDLGLTPKTAGATIPFQPLLLGKGRELYEAHVARPRVMGGVRVSTRKRYKAVFDKFIPLLGSKGVATWNGVTEQHITDYIRHLEQSGYKPKTLQNELVTIKQTLTWLCKKGHLVGFQPISIPIRKTQGEHAYCYRQEELNAMIQLCRKDQNLNWLGDVVVALACTGLRISELASLRWADIDRENGMLTLREDVGQAPGPTTGGRELKSECSSRSFPIHSMLRQVLRGLPRIDRYVFHGPRGGRLKPDTLRRILVRDVIGPLQDRFPGTDGEKSLKDGRLHSFRHYFCSRCANQGVPERVTLNWLGHSSSEMIRHYYHLYDDESREKMNRLEFLEDSDGPADA